MSLTIEERQLIELRIRNDAPSVVVAYVMWGFLGLISAHRFYLGRPRSAVLQILSWLTVIGGVIWWLYDAVMISAYIRDDKNALRTKLIEELESEKRGGGPVPRPRIVETPADRAPTPPPAKSAPPTAAAASMPAKPTKPVTDSDLVLVSRAGQPLVLDDPRPAPAEAAAPTPAAASAGPPKIAIKLDDRAEAQAAATLAFSEPEPAPAPELKAEPLAPPVPHPEAVDDSPIEVFPPKATLAGPPGAPIPAPQAEPESPAPRADEWVVGEPLRLDRTP